MVPLSPLTSRLDAPRIIFESAELGHHFYASAVHLIGFGFDGTACFRKGAKDGPNAIREVSFGIESYSPYLDKDLEDYQLIDLGNLPIDANESIEQQWQQATDILYQQLQSVDLVKNNIRLITLGGEHSISYAPALSYLEQFDDLQVIHLDAHADLRDGYEGYHYSHASIIYRLQEKFGPEHSLLQYGIRSGTKEEYRWMNEHQSLSHSRQDFLAQVAAIDASRPIYLTLDLDYFDPSFFPGTGTPEPGGEDFHSFVSLLKLLQQKNLVGCDVVELAPAIDSTGNSSVFAAKVVRELALCMSSPQSKKALEDNA
ncbi:MAG: agmatinase [Kangiellaceae bacterium]